MALTLKQLEQELLGSPLQSPYSNELAVAVVSDAFRLANLKPPPSTTYEQLKQKHPERLPEQMGMLAHLLASTHLRDETSEALRKTARDLVAGLTNFFEQVEPLTAEMVRGNAFRREEFVRKWAATWGVPIAGETAEQSQQKLTALDYRQTLAEYQRAEAARKAEADKRAQLLREAQEREAAARGWRE
jgi:hypothetical protein